MAEGFVYRNRTELKTLMRVVFGIVWFIDGALKFQSGIPAAFPQLILNAGQGQPAWLGSWFTFWYNAVGSNALFWVYLIGIGELLLGIGLILGGLRKITYIVGFFFSFLIWAIPEGFGGPYGPSSTDIGTGAIYAIVFLALILINAEYGPSKYSIDTWLEKKIRWWYKIAEFSTPKRTKG